jgi:hypothetical protein
MIFSLQFGFMSFALNGRERNNYRGVLGLPVVTVSRGAGVSICQDSLSAFAGRTSTLAFVVNAKRIVEV